MSNDVIVIEGVVSTVDRATLASATHKFKAYYSGNHLVPFNVFCESCQQYCAIDNVTMPGHTIFHCTGQFKHYSKSHLSRCGFQLTVADSKTT